MLSGLARIPVDRHVRLMEGTCFTALKRFTAGREFANHPSDLRCDPRRTASAGLSAAYDNQFLKRYDH